jgi:alpha 1,6-mannosyltransferase
MSGLKEPMLFGDILVMPINSFASGVSHSGSVENSTEALAVHKFDAAWRTADEDKRWFWMY